MVRPLRIEYPGAVYHVTSRGDRREPIAKDDVDRPLFLKIVGQAAQRFDARAWAYCLMGNHYHLVLHTREANLSRLMRQINGVYTQSFNRRHATERPSVSRPLQSHTRGPRQLRAGGVPLRRSRPACKSKAQHQQNPHQRARARRRSKALRRDEDHQQRSA